MNNNNFQRPEDFGLPKNYKTLSERILDFMSDGKWYQARKIRKALGIRYYPGRRSWETPHPLYSQYTCFNTELMRLTKRGFILRATAPDFLSSKGERVNYVYKSLKKPFTAVYEAVNGGNTILMNRANEARRLKIKKFTDKPDKEE